MGEEEKKADEPNVESEEKKVNVQPKAEKLPENEKKEETKSELAEAEQTPLPPQEIILKVFMHCEGCARKVRRCLKGFLGVEDVITDCKSRKVIVKGEKADPLKVLERVQRKSHRQVELISPIPKPEEAKKPDEEKEVVVITEEKKEEVVVITVVLGVYMHCEACAQQLKRRIQRMKGVQSAEPELKSSEVTVKGTFEPDKLIDHVYKRTGKHAIIMKVEPEKKEDDDKGKEQKEEENAEEGDKEAKKEDDKENKEVATAAAEDGGPPMEKPEAEVEDQKLDMKKNEFYYYHAQNYYPHFQQQHFVQDMYAYPPAPVIFSEENPNACSVM